MIEVAKVILHNFNEYIRIANKRSVKPFLKNSKKKLPKKYQTDEYCWNSNGKLIDAKTGTIIPSNPIMAGTPRDWKINGQDVYNQKVKHSARAAIATKLHEKFKPALKELGKLNEELYPLVLCLHFYIKDENKQKTKAKNIDNDNKWIYEKAIQDTMVELGTIPDDNPYIIDGNIKRTFFVENDEDVRLEIILLKDE